MKIFGAVAAAFFLVVGCDFNGCNYSRYGLNEVSLASFEYDNMKMQCRICRIKRGEKVSVTVE